MATLLNRAIKRLKGLPKTQQDFYAHKILVETNGDKKWARVLSNPENEKVIDHLAREADADIEKGDVLNSKEFFGSVGV